MLWWPDQLHGPGFIDAGNHTTAATHALFRGNGGALCPDFQVISHLDSAKLAFFKAGSASFALFGVHHSFKAALGHPVRYPIFILPEHMPEWRAAAPVTIAY